MRLPEYAKFLGWLAGIGSQVDADAESGQAMTAGPRVLQRLRLDPTEFADLAGNFRTRFSTAAGCPASIERDAERRGRRRRLIAS